MTNIPTRALGRHGLHVSALGLGCMGMSDFYGDAAERNEPESISVIHRAIEIGVNFLDTSDMYGPWTNEELVGKAIAGRRAEFVVATKFGIVRDPANPARRGANGRPEYVRACCDASLKRLNTDYIDLFYQHRIDKSVPIEETIGAMAELVTAGKVRYLGMSEAGPANLRRAAAVLSEKTPPAVKDMARKAADEVKQHPIASTAAALTAAAALISLLASARKKKTA